LQPALSARRADSLEVQASAGDAVPGGARTAS
jgi:hypothetical protein